MWEGFKPITILTGSAFLSITKNGLNFNKNVVLRMNSPKFVKFMLNAEKKLLAIQAVDENDPYAVKFVREGAKAENGVRYNNRDLENTFTSLMNWDVSQYNYRIDGNYDAAEHAMIFDLNSARNFSVRKPR